MSQPPISRGFRARKSPRAESARVPPGQHLVERLSGAFRGADAGDDLESWSFALRTATRRSANGAGMNSTRCRRPRSTVDIHCVTTWSKLDTHWRGVAIDDAAGGGGPERAAGAVRAGPLRRRLHHQRAGRGPGRRQGDDRDRITTASRSIPSMAARRGCWCRISISGRAPNGCAGCNSSTRDAARLLGGARLPHLRRSLARAALCRRLI